MGQFMLRNVSVILLLLSCNSLVRAGLYYSGEQYASLPAQWRGFLLDQRLLRNIALKPKSAAEAGPMRLHDLQEAEKLQARARKAPLGADDLADLGALYIRLGEADRAVELLRKAQASHPNHFAIAANQGTAWQLLGDLRQAVSALEQSVRLAPGKVLAYEQAHLKLVRGRLRSKTGELDDLFGIRYVGDKGFYEPGKLASAEKKKLPARAVAITQQLALWLPADGPLLWQLAELANAHGDLRNAAAMMEGCVVQFGMQNATLREHRRLVRAAADEQPPLKLGVNEDHVNRHQGSLAFRSRRPLLSKLASAALPPIETKGIHRIPWELFGETTLEKPFKPGFPRYLQELQGKQVAMTGFMYPLREDADMHAFLFIEAPVGCWYCEAPDSTGIVFVELPAGQTTHYQRGMVRITGRLQLNSTEPEDFLYAVKDARVNALD
jgi:tetratricopeptide (TPR) repeat protein